MVNAPAISWAAGTVGSFAVSNIVNVSKTGYTPIGATLRSVGHGSEYSVLVILDYNKLAFQYYRANTSAVSRNAGDSQAFVIYMKNE